MIKIKDYILNENDISYIVRNTDDDRELKILWKDFTSTYIKATFDDIEWNYDSKERQYNEETEQLISSLKIRNYNLQDRIKELEEENKTLKELNVCVGCDNNPDYKSRIDKALLYIKENVAVYGFGNKALPHWEFDDNNIQDLLKILKGEE